MFRLPKSVPAEIRLLLEKQLADLPFDEALEQLAPIVLRLFNAKDLLFFFHPEGEQKDSPLWKWASANPARSKIEAAAFAERWVAAGIDAAIEKDLLSRTSCVSYSAFSWPYPRIASQDEAAESLRAPSDFTLLLPVTSQLCVCHERDNAFSGYYLLLFDSFPQLSDQIVQLITYLPQTLSDLILFYLRADAAGEREDLSAFAHDIKRSLLFSEEQVRSLRTACPTDVPELLDKLERSLKKMIHRASAIMLADRTQFGNLRISSLPISLNEIISDTVESFQSQLAHSRAELRIELAEDLPLSPIDPAIFPTVLENLLENALKYSGSGAVIYLTTKPGRDANVRLEVADDGPGVPESEWENVFLKHYRGKTSQTQEQGNGLGLYLVQKIVEAHGGRVYPERAEDKRMCFVVELPAVRKQ